MPYKTIQQNFANGELNPKMQGRTDVDMYYKSAQKMRNVATTPYGGFVRRPGTTKIGELTDYYEEQGNKDVRLIPFVFNNNLSYAIALKEGGIDVFGEDRLAEHLDVKYFTKERLSQIRYAQSADTCFFVHPDFKPLKLERQGYVDETSTEHNVQVKDGYVGVLNYDRGASALGAGKELKVSKEDLLEIRWCVKCPMPQEEWKKETRFVFADYIDIKVSFIGGNPNSGVELACICEDYITGVGEKIHNVAITVPFEEGIVCYMKLTKDSNSTYTFSYSTDNEVFTTIGSFTPSLEKIKEIEYVPTIYFTGGSFLTQLKDTYIKVNNQMFWKYKSAGDWYISQVSFDSVPFYNFNAISPTKGKGTLTPDAVDGTVKMTLSSAISENLVGQYIEGNGGRVKVTSQDGTTLTGYTVIGFYTKDTIKEGNWTYTTNYEAVWSEERGWPCSVTFHQGRLWFGGSKERPQTVWGSKVGLFYKFDPTAGYDNDAIEFTLDTESLNKITDIYSAKGLYIFTLGGEFVCQTSYGEPITPKNVSALKQSSNGSWENTQPVELEGSVIFVERRGQALMNFAYLTEDDYATSNASLVNSHLINQPEDLDVERNNLTQQTNYVYIVNKDGTMCVVNLLAAQGISGGFTLWQTEGKIKSVCVLPDATYIAVERELQGQYKKQKIFLEKLDWNVLTDCTQSFVYSGGVANSIPGDHTDFMLKDVDILANGEYLCSSTVTDSGLLVSSKVLPEGTISWGLPFRSYVQSNFLEVPQMGTGVGRMKRLASMVVRVLDTPEVTINGETQKCKGEGIEDIHFYGIGDWDEKPTWEFTERTPHKFNIMAAQMDLNYQLSTESY